MYYFKLFAINNLNMNFENKKNAMYKKKVTHNLTHVFKDSYHLLSAE